MGLYYKYKVYIYGKLSDECGYITPEGYELPNQLSN